MVVPTGLFDNGVVQFDLEDAATATMWYRMYPKVIRGVVILGDDAPQGEALRSELQWTTAVLTRCHEMGQLHVEGYDPSIIETYPLGVRLVIVRFHYPDDEIFKDPYQVHDDGFGKKERWYAERTHPYIEEQRLYEDKESGVQFMDVFDDIDAYLILSLYHPQEIQAAWGKMYPLHPCTKKMRSTHLSPQN